GTGRRGAHQGQPRGENGAHHRGTFGGHEHV
ncbi:uncharacterized protein METZ01_LOCUS427554, partial [marine metagenome]